MASKQPNSKPQFLTKIALAFLVFFGFAPTVNASIIDDIFALPGHLADGAQIAAAEVLPSIFNPASLVSVFNDIKCFFGFGCPEKTITSILKPAQTKIEIKNPGSQSLTSVTTQEDRLSNNQSPAAAPTQIIQNINPTREIQTIRTVNNNINTVVVDTVTKNKVDQLLRQLNSDRPNYSTGQSVSLPTNLVSKTLTITSGAFNVDDNGNATANNIAANGNLTVQGNFTVAGAQTYSGAASFSATSTVPALALSQTGAGLALLADSISMKGSTISTTGTDTDLLFNPAGDIQFYNSNSRLDSSGNLALAGSVTASGTGVNYFAGNVGIGTTSPGAKLESMGTYGLPANSGSVQTYNSLRLSQTAGTAVMDMGLGGAMGWIQTGLNSDLSNHAVGLLLNPNGGNVGIGTTSPAYLLHVVKSQNSGTTFEVLNDDLGTGAFANYKIAANGANLYAYQFGPNYTSASARYTASTGVLDETGSGGLNLAASNASGIIRFYTVSNNERLRIDSSGNVGIGTTAPGAKLDVRAPGGGYSAILRLGTQSNMVNNAPIGSLDFWNGTSSYGGAQTAAQIKAIAGNSYGTGGLLTFSTSATGNPGGELTEYMRIATNGNVGIGTTNPSQLLDVAGKVVVDGVNGRVGIGTTTPAENLEIGGGNLRIWNDASLGDELASWVNHPTTYPYETFTPSGTDITLGNTTGYGIAYNAIPNAKAGELYKITFDMTLNSGTMPAFRVSSIISYTSTYIFTKVITTGTNVIYFYAPTNATLYTGFVSGNNIATNFTTSGYSLKKVTGGNIIASGLFVAGSTEGSNYFGSNVGIGTANPATMLQVVDTSTASPRGIMSSQYNDGADGARFHMRKARGTLEAPTTILTGDTLGKLVASGYDGSNYLEMGAIAINAEGTVASTRVPTNITFSTATNAAPSVLAEAMRIDSSGRVGIGTTSPSEKLHVVGNIRNSALAGTGNRAVYSDADGNLTNTSSDIRLKTNIENLADRLDILGTLGQLRGIYYNWDVSNGAVQGLGTQREIGMAAQEVQAVMPELVGQNASGYLSLDYPKMTAYLVEVAKAQQKEIDGLKLVLEPDGAVGNASSTLALGSGNGLFDWAANVLNSLGMVLKDGVASLKEVAADKFTAKQANIEQIQNKQIQTEQMCISGSDGQSVCLNKDQLKDLIQRADSSVTINQTYQAPVAPLINGTTTDAGE